MMGADNWSVCPGCKAIDDAKQAKKQAELDKSYGKVDMEKFLAMQKVLDAPIEYGKTMREDYEIGIDSEGVFDIHYSAGCHRCGLKFEHNHSEEVTGV